MGAYRCKDCDFVFAQFGNAKCPVCEGPTTYESKLVPDGDWQARAHSLRAWHTRDVLDPYPNMDIPVAEHEGRAFIVESLLNEHGCYPEVGMVITVRSVFYEVHGRFQPQNREDPIAWWVEAIDPETEFASLPVLGDEEAETEEAEQAPGPAESESS